MPDTSTERVRRHRTHKTGDHSNCNYQHCAERQELEYACNRAYYIKAVIEELERRGVDPADFFGNCWDETQAQANREFPDWLVELTVTEDIGITPIRARYDVERCLAESHD